MIKRLLKDVFGTAGYAIWEMTVVGGCLILMALAALVVIVVIGLIMLLYYLAAPAAESPEPSAPAPVAESPEPATPTAEYPQPSKERIEVVVQIAGSEGGSYVVRAETRGEDDVAEKFGTLFSLGDTDHEGVLGSEPTEYRFNMGDGVTTDSDGNVEWDSILINIDKYANWEGEIYAKMFVNGELADCRDTDSNWAIRFSWTPPDGTLSSFGGLPCRMYPGF